MARHGYVLSALVFFVVACGGRATPTDDGAVRVDGLVVDQRLADQRVVEDARFFPDGPGECLTHEACGPDLYCHLDGCFSSAAVLGECRLRPEECPQMMDPVCGCDGQTYANGCEAHAARVNVAHAARCEICTDLEASYDVLLASAKRCCPFCDSVQCTEKMDDRLSCGCPTAVDAANSAEIAKAMDVRSRWTEAGCFNSPPCPPFACQELQRGYCAPDAVGEGSCKDVYR